MGRWSFLSAWPKEKGMQICSSSMRDSQHAWTADGITFSTDSRSITSERSGEFLFGTTLILLCASLECFLTFARVSMRHFLNASPTDSSILLTQSLFSLLAFVKEKNKQWKRIRVSLLGIYTSLVQWRSHSLWCFLLRGQQNLIIWLGILALPESVAGIQWQSPHALEKKKMPITSTSTIMSSSLQTLLHWTILA